MNRFLSQCLAWLDARASWVQLSNIRDSFLSKATTAFSVATFGLANLAAPLGRLGVDLWQLRLLFPGSMLFLIGYLVMAIRIPLEFQGSRTLDEIVDRMSRVHTYTFLKSRLDMTRAMLDRREAKGTPERMRGAVKYAKAEAATIRTAAADGYECFTAGVHEKQDVRGEKRCIMRVGLHGLDPLVLVIHALRGTFQGVFTSEV